jgi:hypothetical protein
VPPALGAAPPAVGWLAGRHRDLGRRGRRRGRAAVLSRRHATITYGSETRAAHAQTCQPTYGFRWDASGLGQLVRNCNSRKNGSRRVSRPQVGPRAASPWAGLGGPEPLAHLLG